VGATHGLTYSTLLLMCMLADHPSPPDFLHENAIMVLMDTKMERVPQCIIARRSKAEIPPERGTLAKHTFRCP
jgi:hypothetical protein